MWIFDLLSAIDYLVDVREQGCGLGCLFPIMLTVCLYIMLECWKNHSYILAVIFTAITLFLFFVYFRALWRDILLRRSGYKEDRRKAEQAKETGETEE